MNKKLLKIKLSHCGPTCSHYWIYDDGPWCCPLGKKGHAIPEEYDKDNGFPEFCALENTER